MNTKLLKRFRRKAEKDISVLMINNKRSFVILDEGIVRFHWDGENWVYFKSNCLPAEYSKSLIFMGYCDAVRGYILYLAELEKNERIKKEYHQEYKILDTCVIGIRREESRKRAVRYKEPSVCRIYSKTEHVEHVMPILDWTLQDIAEFVSERKIKLAPVYYREDGTIDFSRRLGCLCCPIASLNYRKEEFAKYPKMVRAYIKAGVKFWETHPKSKIHHWFSDVYEYFAVNLFYPKLKDAPLNKTVLFPTDYKSLLEKKYNISLDD